MPDALTIPGLFSLHERAWAVSPASASDIAWPAAAIEWRRKDEVHDCLRCGARAVTAILSRTSDLVGRPRWLDLCAADYAALVRLVTGTGWPDDGTLVRLHEAWAAGDQPRFDTLLAAWRNGTTAAVP